MPSQSAYSYQLPIGNGSVTSGTHRSLLRAAARIPTIPFEDENSKPVPDIFDNPFIPTQQIAYLPSDFSTLAPSRNSNYIGQDPSVWRVPRDEPSMFVNPKDLIESPRKKVAESDTKPGYTFPYVHRPTLDEFMGNREMHRDSFCNVMSADPSFLEPAFDNGVRAHPYNKLRDGPRSSIKNGRKSPAKTVRFTDVIESGKRLFPCTFDDCQQVCQTKSDLARHLRSRDHQEPSVACSNGCGAMFTRDDAAKRHKSSNKCPMNSVRKVRVRR